MGPLVYHVPCWFSGGRSDVNSVNPLWPLSMSGHPTVDCWAHIMPQPLRLWRWEPEVSAFTSPVPLPAARPDWLFLENLLNLEALPYLFQWNMVWSHHFLLYLEGLKVTLIKWLSPESESFTCPSGACGHTGKTTVTSSNKGTGRCLPAPKIFCHVLTV